MTKWRWLALAWLAMGCAGVATPPATTPIAPATLDEPALMARLRETVGTHPASALTLADEGEQRFGDSQAAEERRALAITALIKLDRIGSARSLAYDFLRRYPDGPYAANVAAMTGVHLTPSGPGEAQR